MGCVYCAKCLRNGMLYIGKTVCNLERRKAEHLRLAKAGDTSPFHNAIRKYSPEWFIWTILFEGDNNAELLCREQLTIAMKNTKTPHGYNLTEGGEGTCGHRRSEETRAKLSAAGRRRRHSPETRAKIGAASRGRECSPEHRAKVSAALKGVERSLETRAKLSAARKGKRHSLKTRAAMSVTRTGKRKSPATRAKISNSNKQAHFSTLFRRLNSEAARV